jgi:hypothetical protein
VGHRTRLDRPRRRLLATVEADAAASWEAIAGQSGFPLRKGATYTLTFDAKASAAAQMRAITPN